MIKILSIHCNKILNICIMIKYHDTVYQNFINYIKTKQKDKIKKPELE